MNRHVVKWRLALLLGIMLTGCDQPAPTASSPTSAPPPPPPPPTAAPETPAEPPTEVVKAEAGVGKQGQSLEEYEGVVVTPVKTLFAFKQKAVFDIEVPYALKLYKASGEEMPKDFDDLKAKVLDPNNIKLPELPPMQRYLYSPETEELQVQRPRKKGE